MQIVTSWMEEGIGQGLAQGRQEGAKNEALALVTRLVARRVGIVAPDIQERITSLSIIELENLVEALLDFRSSADLIHWLDNLPST